jgi:hypothetical protein
VPVLPATLLHFADAPAPSDGPSVKEGADRSKLERPPRLTVLWDIDNHFVGLPEDFPQFLNEMDLSRSSLKFLFSLGFFFFGGSQI